MGDAQHGVLFTAEDVRVMLLTAYERGRDDGLLRSLPANENERGAALLREALANDFAPTFAAGEPLFLVRGSDPVAGPVVAAYALGLLNIDGMTEADERVQRAQTTRVTIEAWQAEHPDRVKVPD